MRPFSCPAQPPPPPPRAQIAAANVIDFTSSSDGYNTLSNQLTISARQQWAPFTVAMWVVLETNFQLVPLFEFSDPSSMSENKNFMALFMTNASATSSAATGTVQFQFLLQENDAFYYSDASTYAYNGPLFNYSQTTTVALRPTVW